MRHSNGTKLCLMVVIPAFLAGILAIVGCSTGAKVEGPPKKLYYTLKAGEVTKHSDPLPDETPIFVNWHYSNGAVKSVVGFRGWDFAGDKRYEMMEVYTEDGKTKAYVFDFDNDGQIDIINRAAAGPVKAKPH